MLQMKANISGHHTKTLIPLILPLQYIGEKPQTEILKFCSRVIEQKKSIMTFKIIDYIALLTLELRNLTNWIKKSYCSHLYILEDLFSI